MYNDTVLTCSATASDVDQTVTPTYVDSEWVHVNRCLSIYLRFPPLLETWSPVRHPLLTPMVDKQRQYPVTILNRSPSIDSITLSSSVYNKRYGYVQSSTSDADGDSVTTSIERQVGGVVLGSQNLTIRCFNGITSRYLDCVVTAIDTEGATVTSTQSVISKTPVQHWIQ